MVKVNNHRLVFIVKMMFIILFTVSLFSCSSKRNLVDNPIADAPPITFNKLIRNIDTAYVKEVNKYLLYSPGNIFSILQLLIMEKKKTIYTCICIYV